MNDATLGDLLEHNARHLPDQVATVFGDRRITYLEHFHNARRLANALAGAGLRRQSRVAILARNSPEYIDIFGAAQLAGYIAATVNFRLATPEIAWILGDASPTVLFFEDTHTEAVDAIRAQLPAIRTYVCLGRTPPWAISYAEFLATGTDADPPTRAAADDVVHIIYTSGTTGRPKGVMRTHRAELEYASLQAGEIDILSSSIVLVMMPLFHVGARWVQLACQVRGAVVILHREFDELEVLQDIARHRVSVTHMAPTIVQRVLEHPRVDEFDLSSLRTMYYSAAPMPLNVLRKGMAKFGSIFVQLYGMTEGAGTTLRKSQHRPDGTPQERAWLSSVGQAPLGVGIRILDDAGESCAPGTPGEIATRTSTRMLGYWNNSAATIDAMDDGWYRTGDVGYLDAQGFLYLVDRKKDMIISGGENIYCREVEEAIAADEAISEVAVIGVPDPQWGESVKAVVVLRPGHQRSAAQVIESCRQRIASYKKPKSVVFVDALPRMTTGKVDKKALRAIYAAAPAA
jgi:acyl-CoA synthetase (AMP-forming)/AMP-acid ligase II